MKKRYYSLDPDDESQRRIELQATIENLGDLFAEGEIDQDTLDLKLDEAWARED